MSIINEQIEAKVKLAEDNIKNSYKQYIEDIEGIKALMPENQRHIINELAAEADRRQERLLSIASIYLRPYVTAHIRRILALDKIITAANDSGNTNRHSA